MRLLLFDPDDLSCWKHWNISAKINGEMPMKYNLETCEKCDTLTDIWKFWKQLFGWNKQAF